MFKFFNPVRRKLRRYKGIVQQINVSTKKLQELTHDGLRDYASELGLRMRKELAKYYQEVEEIKRRLNQGDNKDIFEVSRLYNEIEEKQEEAFKKSETALLQYIPEAFAVMKDTCCRFAQGPYVAVTANFSDQFLADDRRSYVVCEEGRAIYSKTWDAVGTEIVWNMVPYDNQLLAAVILQHGEIAEMLNGEGKTLAAVFPLFLNGLARRKVHICTANDFLSLRDYQWMRPLLEFHGVNIGEINSTQPNSEARRRAYKADIVYGTADEFGFDYLRDNMLSNDDEIVQSGLNFILIDEIDSVLIDEARTPLVISGPMKKREFVLDQFQLLKPLAVAVVEEQEKLMDDFFGEAKKLWEQGDRENACWFLYRIKRGSPYYPAMYDMVNSVTGVFAALSKFEKNFDTTQTKDKIDEQLFFVFGESGIEFTEKGSLFFANVTGVSTFLEDPDLDKGMTSIENEQLSLEEEVNRKRELVSEFESQQEKKNFLLKLVQAFVLMVKDVDYVVLNEAVYLVDSNTGRLMPGRAYSNGLQQAIEVKEGVAPRELTESLATVSLQAFFRRYPKLAGMTATAKIDEREYKTIYNKPVIPIPPYKPNARVDLQDIVFRSKIEKIKAVVDDVKYLIRANRPVLIGTNTVEDSELLSRRLTASGIAHNVLNAKHHKSEALIIAEAGIAGTVTVAARMAGRGTDIKLTQESIAAGGLAVLGFERHETRRLDYQLKGRAGRQGDPGTSQFYVSLEDDLMRKFGSEAIASLMDKLGYKEGEIIQHSMISASITRAQKKTEQYNLGTRTRLYEYDNSLNLAREGLYTKRNHALSGYRVELDVMLMFDEVCRMVVLDSKKSYQRFVLRVLNTFNYNTSISIQDFDRLDEKKLIDLLYVESYKNYQIITDEMGRTMYPVFSNIRNRQGSHIENVVVPFTGTFNGEIMAFNVLTDLEKGLTTLCKDTLESYQATVILLTIDEHWKKFLKRYNTIREEISLTATLRSGDPMMIFKKNITDYYLELLDEINYEIVNNLCHVNLPLPPQEDRETETADNEKAEENSSKEE